MANEEHVALLKQGVDAWNEWRRENPDVRPDLREADLLREDLCGADLREADLIGATLDVANLQKADLRGADLQRARLDSTELEGADLSGADLRWTHLAGVRLCRANLRRANLRFSHLLDADLTDADLTGSYVYGTSAWNLRLEGAKQRDLVVTAFGEPEVTVDNIEVAQFIYLLLHNQKIRDVIDTIGKKGVLILGRFTPQRKKVLDALREELRRHNYVPILFDFDVPEGRDITETVTLLARMSRFIIADLTDPSSIPKELEAIVPTLAVPIQPLLEGSARPFAMFRDFWKYQWVLPVHWYEGLEPLLINFKEKVIAPAEVKAGALEEQRRAFEASLTKPQ